MTKLKAHDSRRSAVDSARKRSLFAAFRGDYSQFAAVEFQGRCWSGPEHEIENLGTAQARVIIAQYSQGYLCD